MGNKRAVVLLSGGLDSTTTLYYARSKGYKCYCLIFDYGQRHRKEIGFAKKIARAAGCEWHLLKFKLPRKGSALLDKNAKLPVTDYQERSEAKPPRRGLPVTIPSTYVPARNIIFLSFALHYAESRGAGAIFIGANAIDYSGYPDCRPEFFRAFRQAAKTGTKSGARIKIEAPLIKKRKKDIVRLAKELKVPLELTWSCYKGAGAPCEVCDSCVLRSRGFSEAGIKDPALD